MGNAQTVVVGTVAVGVFPSVYGSALTVQNSGAVTVYLGETTGLTVATGFPLSPGSTMVWDEGKPLYAVAAAPGQVTILPNGGSLNDVSALATAIIDAGLAADIAQAISVQGVPVIDDPAVLISVPPTNINAGGRQWEADISRYQSALLYVNATTGTSRTPLFPVVYVTVSFQDADNNPMGSTQTNLVACSGAGEGDVLFVRVPAMGTKVTLTMALQSGHSLGTGGTVEAVLNGSYRTISTGPAVGSSGSTLYDAQVAGYISGVDSNLASGLTSFWVRSSASFSTATVLYPAWRNGPIQITMTGQLQTTSSFGRTPYIRVRDALNPTVRYLDLEWSLNTTITLAEDFTLRCGYRPIALEFKDWTAVTGDEPVISLLYDPLL